MWIIWKRDAAGLNYGQTVDLIKELPSGICPLANTCDIIVHGDDSSTVHCVPKSWLYRSDDGYSNGTSYEDALQ